MRVLALAGVALLSAMSVGGALAQQTPTQSPPTQSPPPQSPPPQSAPPPTTYKSLLDQGFEVKNVMLMSGDV